MEIHTSAKQEYAITSILEMLRRPLEVYLIQNDKDGRHVSIFCGEESVTIFQSFIPLMNVTVEKRNGIAIERKIGILDIIVYYCEIDTFSTDVSGDKIGINLEIIGVLSQSDKGHFEIHNFLNKVFSYLN